MEDIKAHYMLGLNLMTVATYYNVIFNSRNILVLVQDLASVKVVTISASESIPLPSQKKEGLHIYLLSTSHAG